MTIRILAAVLFLAMAAPLPAWAQAEPTTDLAQLQGGTFNLDRNHAKIIFGVSHFGFSTYYGLFTDFRGTLTFDPKDVAASGLDVLIHLSGIDTTNPKLDAHLRSADFFDVKAFPTATFKSTKVEVTGLNTGRITGDLTLHGVTKPLTLEATFNGGGMNPPKKVYSLGFNATGMLKRSEFGMTYIVPMVGDEVSLIFSGEFDRMP